MYCTTSHITDNISESKYSCMINLNYKHVDKTCAGSSSATTHLKTTKCTLLQNLILIVKYSS